MMTAGANCTKSPLRVLHVIGGGDRGGALSLVVPLIAALRRKGVEAEILCLGEGILAERAQERAIPVQVLPMRHAADARVLPKLWAAVFEAGRDVVHTHGARANFAVRVLWPFMVQRPRLVTTVHSDIRLDYTRAVRGRFFGWADRLTASFADQIVCVSADLRSRLVARGYPPQKLAVIRPGLELFAVEEKCSGEADWGWADSERAD
ncbi:MAG: glycosyltransferase, partial [Thermoleophilia bacterium]|nr:glycosyltransferase [Thermoleophilia bacterium]